MMFLTAIYAAIMKSWNGFWDEYTLENHERGMQLWHKLY